MTDHRSTEAELTEIGPDAPRRAWRPAVLGALALVAVLGAALVVRGVDDRPHEVAAAVPAGVTAGVGTTSSLDAVSEVVRQVLDRSVPVADRVALVQEGDVGVPVRQLLESFDAAAERVATRATDVRVVPRAQFGDVAIVDVQLDLSGGEFGERADLRTLVLHRDEERGWLLSQESVCGLGAAASMVGRAPSCARSGPFRRVAGAADRATVLTPGSGEVALGAAPIEVGYWSDRPVAVDGAVWSIDYPEMEAGGGGPIGPAHLVRTLVESGAETARVRLDGTEARLAASDAALWVLHEVDVEGRRQTRLARIDPHAAAIVFDVPRPGATTVVAGGSGVWVGDAAPVVHRYEDSSGSMPVGTAEVGVPVGFQSAAGTADELWTRELGGRTRAVSAHDLAVRDVEAPAGTLVASGDRMWSVESGPTGTTARLLRADGGVDVEVELALPAEGDPWGDGSGGLWVSGQAVASSEPSPNVAVEMVQRPYAALVRPDGGVAATWWREGAAQGGWFTSVGGLLAFSEGADLTLLRS